MLLRLQSSTLARLIRSKSGNKAGTQAEGAFLDGSVMRWVMIATWSQTLISPQGSPTAWRSNCSTPHHTALHQPSCSRIAPTFLLVLDIYVSIYVCVSRMADWSKCRFAEANKRLHTFQAGIGTALNGRTSLRVRKLSALTSPIRGAATFGTLASESSSKCLSPPPAWLRSRPGALKVYCSVCPLVSRSLEFSYSDLTWSSRLPPTKHNSSLLWRYHLSQIVTWWDAVLTEQYLAWQKSTLMTWCSWVKKCSWWRLQVKYHSGANTEHTRHLRGNLYWFIFRITVFSENSSVLVGWYVP